MPTSPILLVANDTQPPLLAQLTDGVTGLPIDLTDPALLVYAKFRKKNSTTTIFTALCSKVSGGETAGQVQMDWPAATGLKTLTRGFYEIEWYTVDGTAIQTAFLTTLCRVRKDFA